MLRIFYLSQAGALGVLARYGVTLLLQNWLSDGRSLTLISSRFGPGFPIGTLVINVGGAFLLSALTTMALAGVLSPDLRLLLGTGFCGGYTTFSTFELEADALIGRGEWGAASAYILGNLLLGYAAIVLGRLLVERILGVFPQGVGL